MKKDSQFVYVVHENTNFVLYILSNLGKNRSKIHNKMSEIKMNGLIYESKIDIEIFASDFTKYLSLSTFLHFSLEPNNFYIKRFRSFWQVNGIIECIRLN